MTSIILRTATAYLVPLLLLFSVFLLLRGHDEPGGGFVAGLVAAAAFCLHAMAFGARRARDVLRVSPQDLCAVGVLIACAAGAAGMLRGDALLTVQHVELMLDADGIEASTALLFDVGVYATVLATVLLAVFSLAEEPA